MAGSTSPALLTVDEYLRRPPREDGLRDELIEGEIVLSPSAKPQHAKVVAALFELLRPLRFSGYGIAMEFGCRLGEDSLPGPDVAAIQLERWRNVGEDEFLAGSPELVIEVFSPSNRKALMARKAGLYLEYGAEAVWIVYPKTRTVLVHDADGQHEARLGETVSFHGVVVDVASIFQDI